MACLIFVCNYVQFSVRWRFKLFGIWAAPFVDGENCVCSVSLVGCSCQGDPRCLESGQDLLDTEGERNRGELLSNLTFVSIKPVGFNQLEHEKTFKYVLGALLFLTSTYVSSALCYLHLTHPGSVASPCFLLLPFKIG